MVPCEAKKKTKQTRAEILSIDFDNSLYTILYTKQWKRFEIAFLSKGVVILMNQNELAN